MTEDRDALTDKELEQLEKFIDETCFEIHLEDGDITLVVNHQPASHEGSSWSFGKTIAKVSLEGVVEYDVGAQLEDSLNLDETRAKLLALSGPLRKAADFIEKELKAYETDKWQPYGLVVPRLMLVEDEEDEEEQEDEKKQDEGKSEESGNGDDDPIRFITDDELDSLREIFATGMVEAQIEGEFVVLVALMDGTSIRFAKIPVFDLINYTGDMMSQEGHRQEVLALIGTLAQMQHIAASHLKNKDHYDATAEVIDEKEFLEQLERYRNPFGR